MDKKKKVKILIGCVVLLLLAVIGVLVFLLLRKEEEKPETYTMQKDNYQQIREEMESEVQDGYFETYMNTEWTFKDGTSETTDAVLGNSPNNTKPIRCEVVLSETEETIFTTGVLPVGAQVPPFKLDKDLEAGSYEATCIVYLLNEDEDGNYIDASNAGFNIVITVEN